MSAIAHRFISPHYDDIALSCGGLAASLAASGAPVTAEVVFGEEPDPTAPLSPFAERMHRGWGMGAHEVITGRRAEEATATALLGVRGARLPFRDAIYRGDHYLNDRQLFGVPSPAEAGLPAELVASLGLEGLDRGSVRFYVPLAVGNHVDHQHAFDAGVALARGGWDVRFYEDLPYALMNGALDRRLAALPEGVRLEPAELVPVGDAWERKIDAIFAYPSQLVTIFRHYVGVGTTREEVSDVMRAYAERVGNGVPSERLWKLAGA